MVQVPSAWVLGREKSVDAGRSQCSPGLAQLISQREDALLRTIELAL